MYKWELTGYVEQPVKITEEQLVGIPILAQKIPDCIPDKFHSLNPVKYPFLGDLTIQTFEYCFTLGRLFKDGVVANWGDQHIGFSVDDVTYVAPEFQNKGIGAEILCEKYLYYNVIERRANMKVLPQKAYSENGLKVIKRTYRLLLERGAIYG